MTIGQGPRSLTLGGHVISALSIGGIETCFEIPSFDLCLDIGRCPPGAERRSTLLLTHGHIDHAAGLPYYVSMRSLLRHPPPRVFCPAETAGPLGRILEAWGELKADADRCTLTPVKAGDSLTLTANTCARVFHSPHRVTCVGYTIVRRVRKLRADLIGLPSQAIAARARSGEVIDQWIDRPEICFPGDTTIEVVESEATVREARVLLLECTFLGADVTVKRARAAGHIHLDEIAERADLFQNEAILLTHFSRRYRALEIREAVERRLPAPLLSRVALLIHDAS